VGDGSARHPNFGPWSDQRTYDGPSQGAMTLGAIAWGLSAQIAGTRLTLFAAAFLFCFTSLVLMLLFKIPREQSGSPEKTEAFARLKGPV
jgi:hypothetical protein